jgi:hypothetical protein
MPYPIFLMQLPHTFPPYPSLHCSALYCSPSGQSKACWQVLMAVRLRPHASRLGQGCTCSRWGVQQVGRVHHVLRRYPGTYNIIIWVVVLVQQAPLHNYVSTFHGSNCPGHIGAIVCSGADIAAVQPATAAPKTNQLISPLFPGRSNQDQVPHPHIHHKKQKNVNSLCTAPTT